MHEMALAKDAFRKVTETALAKGLVKITYAKLKIGATRISHSAEFTELFYDLTKGTNAEGMKLEFEIEPVKTICSACQKEFNPEEMRLDCPHCHSTAIKVVAGNDLIVEAVN